MHHIHCDLSMPIQSNECCHCWTFLFYLAHVMCGCVTMWLPRGTLFRLLTYCVVSLCGSESQSAHLRLYSPEQVIKKKHENFHSTTYIT